MKNKKGFTLIELLAVIVLLGLIMVIATSAIGNIIDNSRLNARFIAAKEITEVAIAYMETETDGVTSTGTEKCVLVRKLVDNNYLEGDVTNPGNSKAENITSSSEFGSQKICTLTSAKAQDKQEPKNNVIDPVTGRGKQGYEFDGYVYIFN